MFGSRVKSRRKELRLTQQQLADKIGKSRSALANIETGMQRSSVLLLAKLAHALDTSPDTLMPTLAEAENRTSKKIPLSAKTRPALLDKALQEHSGNTVTLNLHPTTALEEIRQLTDSPSSSRRLPQ